jgi:hypothetical protein
VLLYLYTNGDESLYKVGGIILTGEQQSTERKSSPNAILFTTNPIRNGPRPDIRDDTKACNSLNSAYF